MNTVQSKETIRIGEELHKNLDRLIACGLNTNSGFVPSNDVYVSGKYNSSSVGIKPLGGVHGGKVSGLFGDDLIRDHNERVVGKIGHSGHLEQRWW